MKKWGIRFIIHALLGLVMLFVFNVIGGNWGVSIGVNLINASVIGVLGVCGFALILILNVLSR
jgi:inhibitor of the pro-sigma K processing machinery